MEHPEDKKGIFWSEHYTKLQANTDHWNDIRERFTDVTILVCDFPSSIGQIPLSKFKCAFKDVNDLVYILPTYLLKFILDNGFQLVEVEGEVIESNSQAIFLDEKVKRKPLSIDKLLKNLAKEEAKKHLKEEFKTLNIENYLILN